MPPSPTRRQLLAGLGAAASSSLAGCADMVWPGSGDGPSQVSLSIKTVPAEDDPLAAMIVSQLEENLRTAGINAAREPMEKSELYRQIFVEREYEVFVARHPGLNGADGLRSMLHSRFVGEQGWQNPFGFSDVTVDEHLETQLSSDGNDRHETLSDLFEYLVETAPYAAVTFPDHLGAASSAFELSSLPQQPADYLELLSERPDSRDEDEPLRVGMFGVGSTDRLNPLAVDTSRVGTVLNLLYDPLVREVGAEPTPWLAEHVSWDGPASAGGSLTATVELHDELTWHDGEPLTADDVAFTFEFLEDTSLGEGESSVPALRYRGRESLVDAVTVLDTQTVEFVFDGPTREVARRSLTIPILPEHIWEPRSELVGDLWTAALDTDNDEPIGSGLFSFVEATSDLIELEPVEDHVLRREGVPDYSDPDGDDEYGSIEFRISPGPGAAIEALLEDDLDLIASTLTPGHLEEIEDEPAVSVLTSRTQSFYMIGFNVQQPELGNPNFRRVVSQLVDRDYVVEELFRGRHAMTVETYSSFAGVLDADLGDVSDPALPPFPGTDGEINEAQVRSAFEEAGYRYEDGSLMA